MGRSFDKFAKAEAVENLAGSLYRLLAKNFAGEETTRALFEQLATEEDQHALRVAMLSARYLKKSHDIRHVTLDHEKMDELLADGQVLHRLFSAESFSIGSDEAKRLMIELERKFANAHAQAMIGNSDPSLRSFFQAMAQGDRAHAQLLEASLRIMVRSG